MLPKTVASAQHQLIKHLVKLRKERNYRTFSKTVMIEGKKLVRSVAKGQVLKRLCVEKEEAIEKGWRYEELYLLQGPLFKKICGTLSPEPFVAEVKAPEPALLRRPLKVLALDQLSDPGNLGTLFRTALALSFDAIFLITPCSDPLNDKALRAAKGATFTLPYAMGDTKAFAHFAEKEHLHLYIADPSGEPIEKVVPKSPFILGLGNESRGFSKELLSRAKVISIPLANGVDSLNVAAAGAILMHTLKGGR